MTSRRPSGESIATSAWAAISSSPPSPAQEVEERLGDAIREAEGRRYGELIGEVRAFEGARELLVELRERGHPSVLASSAKEEETEHYIELLDAARADRGATRPPPTSSGPSPSPTWSAAAMQKAGELSAVMVGDSTWDVEAAVARPG